MVNIKNKLLGLILLLLVFTAGASFVLAAEKTLETQYPTIPGADTPTTVKTPLSQYVKYIFNFSIWVVGLVALIAIVSGGVRYLTSAGNASITKDAKDQIFAGILGLIILLSSFIILNTLNPQLLFFNINLPKITGELPTVPPPAGPLEEQTLFAREIPLGELIDGIGEDYESVLAETRLERIITLYENIWKTAEKIRDISEEISVASQELLGLAQQCNCGNCATECGGCDSCPGSCNGDPCAPVRSAIRQQQAILSAKAIEIIPLKTTLENFIEKLNSEKEKLNTALVELEKAESEMKKCPSLVSGQNKTNVLLTDDAFWNYKESLEDEQIIKKMEIKKIWENISAENDEATFYCAETPFDVSLVEETSQGDFTADISISGSSLDSKISCGEPIPAGEIIDNSEDIAKKLIKEFENTIEEIPKIAEEIVKESLGATNLSTLPNCSNCSGLCSCSCSPVIECGSACGTGPDGEEVCEEVCACAGCAVSSPCQGDPCPGDKAAIANLNSLIRENHQKITTSYDKVTANDDEVNNLINGNEIHDAAKKADPPPKGLRASMWAYGIIDTELPGVRASFKYCRNSAEEWTKALSGSLILTKSLLTCEEGKEVCLDIESDYKCYGEEDADAYANYFCAESKLK